MRKEQAIAGGEEYNAYEKIIKDSPVAARHNLKSGKVMHLSRSGYNDMTILSLKWSMNQGIIRACFVRVGRCLNIS